MAEVKHQSLLLSLPPELLSIIATGLKGEHLTSFRLTCRELEAASFDHFIACYCTKRTGYIFSRDRWTQLRDQFAQSPRLASKIRQLVLTADNGEKRLPTAVPSTTSPDTPSSYASPSEEEGFDEYMYLEEYLDYMTSEVERGPSVFTHCFRELSAAPSNMAAIDIDFSAKSDMLHSYEIPCYDLEDAILSTNLAIRSLKLSPMCRTGMGVVLAIYKRESLRVTRSLTSVCFEGKSEEAMTRLWDLFPESELETLSKLLCDSHHLTSVTIGLCDYASSDQPGHLTEMLLNSIRSDALSELSLSHMHVSEDVLSTLLTSCKSTLKRVCLKYVHLEPTDSGWRGVFDTMLEMPALQSMKLAVIAHGLSRLAFRLAWKNIADFTFLKHRMPVDNVTIFKHTFAVRERVNMAAGLRLLTDRSLDIGNFGDVRG